MKKTTLFILVLIVSLFVRIYYLDKLPGEWYGDISNVHEYVTQILEGKWPFYIFQSPGPFYHYLIAPLVFLIKHRGYETYKTASVFVSVFGLITTYFFAKELFNKKIALTTVLIMGISYWYLIWSRLGNSQIVIPFITSLWMYFLVKLRRSGSYWDAFFVIIAAILGLYTYPQTYIFPLIVVGFIIFFLFTRNMRFNHWKIFGLILTLIIGSIPFILMIQKNPGNFSPNGYLGHKLTFVTDMRINELAAIFSENIYKYIKMLHIQGDALFRSNIPNNPHLDRLSGVLFIAGFLLFIKKRKVFWFFSLVILMFLLALPSIIPGIPSGEIPSSSRTVAVIPIVYLMVSCGIYFIFVMLYKFCRIDKKISASAVSLLLMVIVYMNMQLYFHDYVLILPNGNSAPGKKIATYIDKRIPSFVNIYFGSCCWGDWGEPEPKAIAYSLRKERDFIEYGHFLANCREVNRFPALVVIGPSREDLIGDYKQCFAHAKSRKILDEKGRVLFNQVVITDE